MVLNKLKSWYGKYERPISSLSLIGGFVFDALTLKRVDLFWENFWVVAHLVIVGACIVFIHAIEVKEEGDDLAAIALAKAAANPSKLHFWLVNILQFFFGGILSTYLVFYFRSSDIAVSWPFLLILGLCFWANEALKRHFVRLAFQISLFFLSIMCFAIYVVPVLAHKISPDIFLLSGIFSLLFIALFLILIKYTSKTEFKKSKNIIYLAIAGIFIVVNALYFMELIPPLPISLKDAGVFYSIHRIAGGDYAVASEQKNSNNWFALFPDFHKLASQPVFVYSAVFSPESFNMNIVHEWQTLDAISNKWVTVSRINLTVVGGREEGFRTFSEKFNPTPGRWRVNVLTEGGQVIGRIRFNIVLVDNQPATMQLLK